MVKKQQPKRQRDIKSKLMAAICMLLVSTIMMVSSTYAWFTLSTAPEVTGITTAVGANGNLEMALMPTSGLTGDIGSAVGDSMSTTGQSIGAANTTWGNLVSLADAEGNNLYGLDKITLFPAALNVATKDANGNPATLASTMLSTPTYGADGRVNQLMPNTLTAIYEAAEEGGAASFLPGNTVKYGVRGVGTASGMTPRQLDYRNARSAASTAMSQAKSNASASLNGNGSSLANIAIAYGMNGADAKFDKDDVAALRKIINDLNGEKGVFKEIETAYMQYILAYAASRDGGGEADTVWSNVKLLVEAENATLSTVLDKLTTAGMASLPTALNTAINEYNKAVTAVNTADTNLQTMENELKTNENATFTWNQIKEAMTPLANPEKMKVNDILASDVKNKLGDLVSSVTAQGGLRVILETGAGVYADIADQCGDYTASVTIERVEYQGIVLNNMTARMETDTSVSPVYLAAIGTAVEGAGAPASGSASAQPLTDMYGYIIDLAFRTNAAESNLLLQQDAVDRIYSDNTNADTMGHGSSMTFKATTTDFSNDQVKALMSAIRIVFFVPGAQSSQVVATAKLDVANATSGTDGWTAKMYLYKTTAAGGTTYVTPGEGETATHIADPSAEGGYRLATGDETATHVAKTTAAGETALTDNAIMPLTQNQAQALSVLVYLDGDNVGNDDVAATAATSMTGSMSLQFASSAKLVPMEYAALHQGTGAGAETVKVTVPTGVTGNATATKGTDYTFTVNTGYTLGTVTVGGTAVTPTDNGSGSYTIPAASVTGDIVINVTATAGG